MARGHVTPPPLCTTPDPLSNATLLLEVDVVLLPEPGVGQVARVRLGLAGEECILGNVDGDVLRRRDDVGRPCGEKIRGRRRSATLEVWSAPRVAPPHLESGSKTGQRELQCVDASRPPTYRNRLLRRGSSFACLHRVARR